VNPNRLRDPARAQAWIAASGPGSNLLLALACAVLAGLMAAWGGAPAAAGPGRGLGADLHVFLSSLFYYGVFINCVLAVFNLIPIPPLDGSWLVLRWLRGPAAEAYASIRPYGVFVVILLLNFGLGSLFGRVVSAVTSSYLSLAQGVARLLG
jgi:Zn-dependent protease